MRCASTPAVKKREFSVTQLYPRLLYSFSDVVVFVLRNPRAFESTLLEQILGWGPASIDKSVNKPTLPHAIIVLSATEDVDDKEWDITAATRLLMDDIRSAIRQVPQVEEYARIWRQRGRTISSTHDLLKCYYASNLTAPFDFIKEALKHNPIPRDLGGNIRKLALFMQANSPDQAHYEAAHVFTFISPMLASCFRLDSVR
ncbi:hypothetical protein N0V84_006883 [Fusarium piperis]|uniref:Uncharacterized protein n=1 Tax=Fusarium piperis TaxID=1435070 RepID=A0A9W8WB82_9HYPO|nr:hypothetical protein N0V84_006883 [Fusarium piperis]